MHQPSVAELIAIGSELLLGGRLDTNSLVLADALADLGIEVRYKSVVADDCEDIARAIRVAERRVPLVIMTGGLGPTLDDCTREAVALVTKRPLQRSAQALRQLAEWLRSRHRVASGSQLRQAFIPRGGKVLRNPVGSAPGFLVARAGVTVVALPGVPVEAQQMFERSVVPLLRKGRGNRRSIVRRILLTHGLPESEIEEKIADLMPSSSGIRLGTTASPLGVTVSLTWAGPTDMKSAGSKRRSAAGPDQAIETTLAAMRSRLGTLVVGEGRETMEEVVGRVLSSRRLSLATAESCTGGLVGHRLTQVPGSSGYYYGGVVCYSNESKSILLGVAPALIEIHGAVSAEVAVAMADGMKRRSGCAIGLSVTGIAGPAGATASKPVGLVYVGLSYPGRPTTAQEFRFHGPRDVIKLRASQAALNRLRLALYS